MSTTQYIPSASGWSSQKAGFGTSRAGAGRLRVMVVRDYDPVTNQSALTFSVQVWSEYDGLFHAYDGGSFTPHSSAVTIDHHYYVNLQNEGSAPFADPRSLYYEGGGTSTWTRTLAHNSDGSATVSAAVDVTLGYTAGGKTYTMRWVNSGSLSVSENRSSAIASLPPTLRTTETGTLAVTRHNGAYRHRAAFKKGSAALWTSDPFETELSFTPPRSWFDAYPNDASLPLTVEVKTYTDASCATQVGGAAARNMTLYPDAGMAPELAAGFAAVSAHNTGTAASGIVGFVQGYSKAKVRLTKSAVTLKNNAAVASYAVTCLGGTETVSSPGATEDVLTGTLTGDTATAVTVTATDSRGLTAGTTLTVTPLPYAPPTITAVTAFRCDGQGNADDDGQYVSVSAVGAFSSLDGQNTLTLTAKVRQGSGSYGAAAALTSGAASILGGALDPDQKLTVLITATDALGSEATAARVLPTRAWAMKFRADGQGVAFGKPPEYGAKKLELPGDWELMFGAESWLNRVYPVGSIYMSVNSTDPGTLFGGTWTRIRDTFLLAAGTTYSAGSTGGEAAHMQTQNEMPNLKVAYGNGGSGSAGAIAGSVLYTNSPLNGFVTLYRDSAQEAMNNMPPYLAVYVWQRTA